MGVRKFPLFVGLLCNIALFTNGYPESPGTNTYGYDAVLPSIGYGYNNRLSALDIADHNRQLPAKNADRSAINGNYDKLPANNAFNTNEKLINPNSSRDFQSNNAYGNQPAINNGYRNNDKLPAIINIGYGNPNQLQAISNGYGNPNQLSAISNIGYGNPSQLPGNSAYKYNGILPNDAYGYLNRPVYTTTQRPDFSNEPATTLPPLTPQQQIYVNMMNAVMGNPVPELDIAQAAALG